MHALALAALRRLGYRPKNRYVVFQALEHTLGAGKPIIRVLAKVHTTRNAAEYEGYFEADEQLVKELLTALHRALITRRPGVGLLHHSDRGHTYTCAEYRAALASAAITVSMSRRGDCWDNAVVESFFATLKRELGSQEHWHTHRQAEQAVREYLAWYNQQRRYSTLGYLSPAAFETRQAGRVA